MSIEKKKLLIIGGRGALGQELVRHFKQKNVWVASVDHGESEEADLSIITSNLRSMSEQANLIETKIKEVLKIANGGKVFDGIFCVAGGWKGGNVLAPDFLDTMDLMWKQSVESSTVAAYIAGRYLKDGGLVVMVGAQSALKPTPGMVAYGVSKAAVHHLIKTLACEGSGLPKNAVVVGLLPRILDTPNNRKFAGEGSVDFSSWTPLYHVSRVIDDIMRTSGKEQISSGDLAELVTENGETSVEITFSLRNPPSLDRD